LKLFSLSTLLSNQCFPNPITIVFNECRPRCMVVGAVVTRISRICTVKMSESRFRSRISQERRTEGWKRERNSKQKTTVKSVVIKIDLGGEKKRREGIQGIRQTEEVCGLRMSKGQGAKSGPAQAPPAARAWAWAWAWAWHGTTLP
jgi:hypothetical protein